MDNCLEAVGQESTLNHASTCDMVTKELPRDMLREWVQDRTTIEDTDRSDLDIAQADNVKVPEKDNSKTTKRYNCELLLTEMTPVRTEKDAHADIPLALGPQKQSHHGNKGVYMDIWMEGLL